VTPAPPPPDILQTLMGAARQRLREAPPDEGALRQEIERRPAPPDALAALRAPGLRVIAEVKRASPSAGDIAAIPAPATLAARYETGGAAAVSVLTEPTRFRGSLTDLRAVADAVSIPALRKDFLVAPVQLLEARAAGASLVLLIAAALPDRALRDLREEAEALGMHALVETHDAEEVRRALATGARIVGVNNRDLRTFQVDLAVSEGLREALGDGVVAVAESGIHGPADARRLWRAGYRAMLVGTALAAAPNPAAAVASLVRAGDP